MMPEVELRLASMASDLPQLKQGLLEMSARAHATPATLTSTYYDTAEGRLKREGVALCVRKQNHQYIQTVEAQDGRGTVSFARGEREDVIMGERPDLRAPNSSAQLPEGLGEAELHARFTIVVQRSLFTLEPDASTRVDCALDEGEVQTPESERAELICEVKLELKRGDRSALYGTALRLLDVAPLHIEMRSKAERGYSLLEGAVDKPQPQGPPALDLKPDMTVEEALQRIGFGCLATLLRNERAALADVPEGVHQMRIAARRLRSAATAVKQMLPREQYEWVGRELKWLADVLGPARNWDVFSSNLLAPVRSALLSERDRDGLCRACEQERQCAHEKANTAIRSAQYTALVLKLSQWFASCRWRDQPVSEQSALLMAPIGAIAPTLIGRRYKKVRKAAAGFAELSLQQRHQVRIEIKKLRYVIEFLKDLFENARVAEFVQCLKPLQDDLGHANDVRVATDLLADLRISDNAAAIARAAGVVLGWHDRGLADHDRKLLKHVRRFRNARPFW
jgi:triphosphatase